MSTPGGPRYSDSDAYPPHHHPVDGSSERRGRVEDWVQVPVLGISDSVGGGVAAVDWSGRVDAGYSRVPCVSRCIKWPQKSLASLGVWMTGVRDGCRAFPNKDCNFFGEQS